MVDDLPWFRRRGYRHLDVPVNERFAASINSRSVSRHSFAPLLRYIKVIKRYKASEGKTKDKQRPIAYPSHRDACILSKYAHEVSGLLENLYRTLSISEHVIAYRKLGRGNYHFAAEAALFVKSNAPCAVLAFDVSSFFDTLSHAILKNRLRNLLGVAELSPDWYAVFRHVTKYSWFNLEDIKQHPILKERFTSESRGMIASVDQIKSAGVPLNENRLGFGIPQGTPISAAFANLYMVDVDAEMARLCASCGALYRRYSDDLLIICQTSDAARLEEALLASVERERLTIQSAKTERTVILHPKGAKPAQYLGFMFNGKNAAIRPASMSKQWRKMRRAVKRARKAGEAAMAAGKADRIWTKGIRRRFSTTHPGIRNFSSYGRRSSAAFGDDGIVRQIRRLERKFESLVAGFAKAEDAGEA